MHFLIIAPGSRGDVEPLLAVAAELIQSHSASTVTLAAHAEFAAEALSRGVAFVAVPGAPHAGAGAGAVISGAAADELWAAQLAAYRQAATPRPACVLFNLFGLAALHLAEALGLPCVALFPNAPITRTRAYASPLLGAAGLAVPPGDAALRTHLLLEAALWRACSAPLSRWRAELSIPALSDDPTGHFGAMAARRVPVLYGSSGLLLPQTADWPARVIATGPWRLQPVQGWAPPLALADWLGASQAPVLYCGFGSACMADCDAAAQACVAGARARGCRALLTGVLASATLLPADDVFQLSGYVPHTWLLPRCHAALHHCGAGTTAAVAAAGIPSLPVPLQFDQPFWASRLLALEAAPPPLSQPLSCAAVKDALAVALAPPMRAAAARLAQRLASEPDGAQQAARLCAALAGK